MTSSPFRDQIVIITGASAGIGEAVAHRFATLGATVVLVARGIERLHAVRDAILAKGGKATVLTADVGDDTACQSIIAQTLDTHGRIDVLINNAGLHHRGAFADKDPLQLADMVHVNLRSPIYLTRLALPHITARKGAIIFVASLAGCVPVPNSAVYASTKAGLRAFSRSLAEEVRGQDVRVGVVSPGPVATGFILDDIDTVTNLTLSQPIVSADVVAHAVVTSAIDGRPERKLPFQSGLLTTLGYLAPSLGRWLRPSLERRGQKKRLQLLANRAQLEAAASD